MNITFKIVAGVLLGAGIGFLVGYFGRCSTGVCPLTRNPWVSTVIGAVLGFVLTSNR